MKSGVYKITNINNENSYIGSSIDVYKRWNKHKVCLRNGNHHSQHLQNAWNKYGESSFVFEVLLFCEINLLIEKEQHYLDTVKPEYNIARKAGNVLGVKRSVETRKKISLIKKLLSKNPEYIKKLSLSLTGIKRTPEQIANMKIKVTEATRKPEHREKQRKATIELSKNQEWISKQRENSLSQWRDQEFRNKYTRIRKGKKQSYEATEKKRIYMAEVSKRTEWRENNRKARIKTWASRDEEKKKEIGKKISEAQKKRWASYTPEEREKRRQINIKSHKKNNN